MKGQDENSMKIDISGVAKTAVLVIAALGVLVPDVQACAKSTGGAGASAPRLFAPFLQSDSSRPAPPQAENASPENEDGLHGSKIVGLWTVNFYVRDTTELWDFGLEQFYADGNEMTNDTLPPVGGICWGVWEPTTGRTVKLNHLGLGFEGGNFIGMFRLTAELKVARNGDSFSGTYTADQYDLSGIPITKYHGDGNLTAQRVKIDTAKTVPY
jgi:hypothetical protein